MLLTKQNITSIGIPKNGKGENKTVGPRISPFAVFSTFL